MGAAQLVMCALGLEILVGGLGNIKLSGMAAQLSKLGCLLLKYGHTFWDLKR